MKLNDIRPFVRFARFLKIAPQKFWGASIPFDNRLFFMHTGVGVILADGKRYTLNEGDILMIPSGVKYELLPGEKPIVYLAVNYDYTENNSDKKTPVPPLYSGVFESDMRFEEICFADATEFNRVLFVQGLATCEDKLLCMEREYNTHLIYHERMTSSLLCEILIEVLRATRNQRYEKSKNILSDILEFVKNHLDEELSNAKIAEQFGFHKNYISTLLKTHIGMPLHRYLTHLRITRAMQLLSTHTMTVGEVARAVGFEDIYRFSKAFKKTVGVCPSKYE